MENQIQNEMYPVLDPREMQQEKQSSNSMATASLVMGILGLLTSCCCGGFLFGGLGILFALLSRGSGQMTGQAKTGMILSILSLVLGVAVWIGIIFLEFSEIMPLESGIENLPVVPEMPMPSLDNVLTILSCWKGGAW